MISYAQAREDIYLWRALAARVRHDVGFWIDIGGYDPELDSVTKIFSDCGWRGVNVEPLEPNYLRFVEQRPGDINIRAAVTDHAGEVVFHEIVGHQLGTLVAKFADRHADAGMERRTIKVPAMTLAQICEQHAPADIHFLKIDVEGHEAGVIAGMDFAKYRPWILVIEAAEPNNLSVPTYQEWEGMVLAAEYDLVHSDPLNRYYVAREHPELKPAFAAPVDDYVLARDIAHRDQLERRLAAAESELDMLRTEQASRAKQDDSLAPSETIAKAGGASLFSRWLKSATS